ncbi:hypothetical protein BCR36DRAFT_284057 [Piromyces finnis]|uniref:Peptidase S8/S53 domain-containing protein n=1 Tax=Piromyces finnis TaxID=1754191 RepID=A0A1Y1VFM2_9FUNG|nr:hypothetical protein BCR36DRAFT_284057 [Piromyces finnis]|eukprot:ORX53751.1 hypothetical protein BCR36DRAFT_284057 [Piromyces finnis]
MKKNKSILSISLGEYFSVERDAETINFIKENFENLNAKGIVVITSSGNNANNIITEYKNEKYIRLPCALDSVICVGSIDNYGYYSDPYLTLGAAMDMKYMNPNNYSRAPFSNYGEKVNILAPGLRRYDP